MSDARDRPPTHERAVESAESQLERHVNLAVNRGEPCPCEKCARSREFLKAMERS